MKAPAPGRKRVRPRRPERAVAIHPAWPTMRRDPKIRRRLPLAVWIGAGVVGAHALFFWAVWDKHFLPKVPPPPPTPLPVNFGARQTRSIDPLTGRTVVERDFTVSTRLATPIPSPSVSKSP
jgi:hypothetical protein